MFASFNDHEEEHKAEPAPEPARRGRTTIRHDLVPAKIEDLEDAIKDADAYRNDIRNALARGFESSADRLAYNQVLAYYTMEVNKAQEDLRKELDEDQRRRTQALLDKVDYLLGRKRGE